MPATATASTLAMCKNFVSTNGTNGWCFFLLFFAQKVGVFGHDSWYFLTIDNWLTKFGKPIKFESGLENYLGTRRGNSKWYSAEHTEVVGILMLR